MKAKKYFKAVCMALVFCFLVSYAMPATNVEAAQARSILNYSKSSLSEAGLVRVYVSLSVQDSAEQIIGYNIDNIATFSGVTDVQIIDHGLVNNNTTVYVHVSYRYLGKLCDDSAYIDM